MAAEDRSFSDVLQRHCSQCAGDRAVGSPPRQDRNSGRGGQGEILGAIARQQAR